MREVKSLIRLIAQRAQYWNSILKERGRAPNVAPDRPDITTSFAAAELLYSHARLEELLAVLEDLSLDESKLPQRIFHKTDFPLSRQAAADLTKLALESVRMPYAPDRAQGADADNLLEGLVDMRRWLAIAGDSDLAITVRELGVFDDWANVLKQLSDDERQEIERSMQTYFLREWLLPWVKLRSKQITIGERYGALFNYIRALREGRTKVTTSFDIRAWCEKNDIDSNLVPRVIGLIEKLDGLIGDYGLEGLHELLSEASDATGVGRLFEDQINIIPGHGMPRQCHQIVLAIGLGESSSTGLPQVLRSLRGHLIRCYHATKLAVLVTDVWRPSLFAESRTDITEHRRRGIAFLPLLVNRKQITVLDLPY